MSETADNAYGVTPDGTRVLYRQEYRAKASNLAILDLDDKRGSEVLFDSEAADRNGDISADGRWLAYQSNATGRDEVYVRPFPNVDAADLTPLKPFQPE